MNAQDLARIELAKRAYRATQPGEPEVQRGVRRARLALSRTSRRRNWFSKGLVFVVLAVGGLAYAKPQALGELVEKLVPASTDSAAKGARRAVTAAPEAESLAAATLGARSNSKQGATQVERDGDASSAAAQATPDAAGAALEVPAEPVRPSGVAPDDAASVRGGERPLPASASEAQARSAVKSKPSQGGPSKVVGRDAVDATPTASSSGSSAADEQPLSDWGRVGQALAHGDDAKALSALQELAQSADARTRDKADLGRAQLLVASGNLEQGCSLARSLTHRRAGGRIERQALLLLKRCSE